MGFSPNTAGVGSSVSIGEIEGAAVVTAAEGIASNNNDTTIPTSAAVKAYADTKAPALGADDNYVTDAEKVVIGNTSGTNTGDEPSADASTAGVVELATAGETTTGTDTGRAITPDGLAGSDYGKRVFGIQVFASDADTATGDGKAFFRVPSTLNGYNLVAVAANTYTAGTTNTTDIQVRNVTQAADMLTTKITIDSGETDSSTAATAAVIDGNNDDVATGDKISIDVDAVSTTAAQGLYVELVFQLP